MFKTSAALSELRQPVCSALTPPPTNAAAVRGQGCRQEAAGRPKGPQRARTQNSAEPALASLPCVSTAFMSTRPPS
eukprot:CAMPEP_0183512370 /NCGR_PEP_ID=MMETSP0371-20130417/11511_1 /TAXON_ID=268820 /ORGANISM="Peridinium aciculiferum, Strain PAER-2" /LENGTH=75 /DNA_ID=CAMNT_0025709431 /DNA_START=91 /DNA_END=314 /DNA_ORIENTATION=+